MIQEELPFEKLRRCLRCNIEKPSNETYFAIRKKYGKPCLNNNICRDCDRRRVHLFENTPHGSYIKYKRGARHRNYTWDITEEEFERIALQPCVYCGKESEPEVNLNGLDRVYNDIPYMIDNVVACCYYCNFSKGTLDFNEYLEHCTKVHLNSIKKKNKSIRDKRITYEKSNGEWTKVYIKDSEVGEISKENFIDPIW